MTDSRIAPELEALLRDHSFVAGFARDLALDGAERDDALQNAYVRLLESPPASLLDARAWLATVARNASRQAIRSDVRRRERERATARAERVDVADDIELQEVRRAVRLGVMELDEPYRTTLLLRYWADLAPKEIAERTRVPAATVRTRLARGLALMRGRLDERTQGARSVWVLALAAPGIEGHVPLRAASRRYGLFALAASVLLLASGGALWVGGAPAPTAQDADVAVVAGADRGTENSARIRVRVRDQAGEDSPKPDARGISNVSNDTLGSPDAPDGPAALPTAPVREPSVVVSTGVVTGRVLTPGGHGMGDVMVRVRDVNGVSGLEAKTDTDGAFRVEGVALDVGLAVSTSVLHDALAAEDQTVRLSADRPKATLEFHLAPVPELRIRIRAPDGTAVERAQIALRGDGYDATMSPGIAVQLPLGTYVVACECEAGVFGPERIVVDRTGKIERTLQLTAGVSISGVLVDATGVGMSNAQVVVLDDDRSLERDPTYTHRTATTDANGAFTVGGLMRGSYVVRPGGENVPFVDGTYTPAPAADIRVVQVDWRVVRMRLVTVAGTPLPNTVELSFHSGSSGLGGGQHAVLDDHVEFRTSPQADGVSIDAPGVLRTNVEIPREGGSPLDLGDVMLRASRSATGRVIDSEGGAVAGARICFWDASGTSPRGWGETDAHGKFVATELGDELAWLEVSARGFAPTSLRIGDRAAPGPHEITLRAGQLLEGRIRTPDGSPAARRRVYGFPQHPDGSRRGLYIGTRTDAEGRFALRVPLGRFRLRCEAGGQSVDEILQIGAGHPTDLELTIAD